MKMKTYNTYNTFFQKYFYERRPDAKGIKAGDLSERLKLKENLNCKSFQWYIQEVDPELQPEKILHDEL